MIADAGEDADDRAEHVDGAAVEHRSDSELMTPVRMVMTEQMMEPKMLTEPLKNIDQILKCLGDLGVEIQEMKNDRDRYVFSMNDLFSRHIGIVKKLTENAPPFPLALFDALICRSRLNQDGLQRVNYYIGPLLLTQDGKFAATFKNLCDFADPGLVCHPIIALVSDMT